MKTSVLPVLCGIAFVFAGCAETRITGFRDPTFRDVIYDDVVVRAPVGDLIQSKMAEDYFVQSLSRKGVRTRSFIDLFPPTKETSPEVALPQLKAEGVGAVMIVLLKDQGRDVSFTKGTSHSYPRATYSIQLVDCASGLVAWTASAASDGTEAAGTKELLSSLASKTTAVLLEEGLVCPAETTAGR